MAGIFELFFLSQTGNYFSALHWHLSHSLSRVDVLQSAKILIQKEKMTLKSNEKKRQEITYC